MCIWRDTAPRPVAPKVQKCWRPKPGRLFCRLCRQKHRFFATNYCCLLRSGGARGQIGLVYLAGYRSPPGCAKSAKMLAAQARPPLLPTLSPKAPLFCHQLLLSATLRWHERSNRACVYSGIPLPAALRQKHKNAGGPSPAASFAWVVCSVLYTLHPILHWRSAYPLVVGRLLFARRRTKTWPAKTDKAAHPYGRRVPGGDAFGGRHFVGFWPASHPPIANKKA